jgi:hypothetical protein
LVAFEATTGIVVPVSMIGAWFFAQVFEFPFLRHQSSAALVAAARIRPAQPVMVAPAPSREEMLS